MTSWIIIWQERKVPKLAVRDDCPWVVNNQGIIDTHPADWFVTYKSKLSPNYEIRLLSAIPCTADQALKFQLNV